MIKCIFSNIKNEHRYLEQWINYHIRLGFNKFILFEDSDSISHESIINKYTDIIDIDFYDYVHPTNSFEVKELTSFRYILDNYNDIDWIINLNPDEYLTLPDRVTVDDLLYNIKNDKNQILFKWKLYNANGFINEPSHDKYLLKDTYIDDIDIKRLGTFFDSSVLPETYNTGKSIFRYKYFLNEYKDSLNTSISVKFPHLFIDSEIESYDMFYISYFITKSFEEFYNRLKYDKKFKLSDFFVLNPDMIEKIPEIENKFDINVFTFDKK